MSNEAFTRHNHHTLHDARRANNQMGEISRKADTTDFPADVRESWKPRLHFGGSREATGVFRRRSGLYDIISAAKAMTIKWKHASGSDWEKKRIRRDDNYAPGNRAVRFEGVTCSGREKAVSFRVARVISNGWFTCRFLFDGVSLAYAT